MAEDRFDGLFLTLAQQCQGIDNLMDNLFSFLRRKSDFYNGATPEKVEELVLQLLRKHSKLAENDKLQKKALKEKEERLKKEKLEKKRMEEAAAAAAKIESNKKSQTKVADDDVIELSDDGSFDISNVSSVSKADVITTPSINISEENVSNNSPESSVPVTEDDKKDTQEEDDKIPPRNTLLFLFLLSITIIIMYSFNFHS